MPGFPVPSEARLEALLREAYEFMPGPDMVRMGEIETHLLRRARAPARATRTRLPWWAVLLLAGGAATAAWWTGEQLDGRDTVSVRSSHDVQETAGEPVPARPADRVEPGATQRADGQEPGGEEKRIIYERETP